MSRIILTVIAVAAVLAAVYWAFAPPQIPRDLSGKTGQRVPQAEVVQDPADAGSEATADPPSEVSEESVASKVQKLVAGDHETSEAGSQIKPLLSGWQDPGAVILFTGEQHGYVEPCGCSLKQLGGVSRRADLIRQLQERHYPVAAFDLGGLVNRPTRKQGKMKLQFALHALKDMQYDAVGLGPEELRNGIDLITYEDRPPFLACNIVIAGDPGLGLVLPHLVRTVGATKIGVTAVFGRSLSAEIITQTEAAEVEVLDPLESLRKSLAELEAQQPDLLILLSHAAPDETRRLAAEFPQLDIVAATGGPDDPNPNPSFVGKTLWIWPGQKGKYVSIAGFFPQDAAKRLRFEAVAIDEDRFRDTAHMQDHMRHYQELLELQKLVSLEPAIGHPLNATVTEANDFVGAQACGECHKKAYANWQKTGHARATVSIQQGRAGQEATYISRIHDPECVACHVTGWDPKQMVRYQSGWVDAATTPHLEGQQCENCHGPGGRHTELERLLATGGESPDSSEVDRWREFAHLSVDKAFDLCARCHDGDNDPHFHTPTFPEYWEKIKHPWLD